jgi:hypothetical protein
VSAPGGPTAPRSLAPALGLLVAPALTAAAALAAPRVAVSEAAAAALAFAGGAAASLLALAIAARASYGLRVALALGAGGGALLGVAAVVAARWPVLALVMVDLALVSVAHAVGGAIGRRVVHPGHLLPACAVAAAADLASVLHPAGPSHAIAESERALSFLAVGFPVPGTSAVAPALGVGDLVFVALVFGVAAAHRLSLLRMGVAVAAGLAVAGALAARFEAAVPALVPIGAAVVAGVPAARRLRPEDRRTTAVAVAAAAAVVAGVLLTPR